MADDLITQADVEQRIGATTLGKLLADDGGVTADPDNVAWMMKTASKIAYGILYAALSSDEKIQAVVDADEAVKNDVVEIAVGLAGGRRQGFLGAEGKTPYSGWRERAEARLKEIAAGKRRAIGEQTGGKNEKLAASTSPTRDPVFGASASDPTGPGGF